MSKWINIRINADNGEAKVVLTDAFFDMEPVWQVDILSDCFYFMGKLYEESVKRMDEHYDKKRSDAECRREAEGLVAELMAEFNRQ
jgi:hypothetical protein